MTYLSTVLADAPAHYWRCADGGGQIAHDIGSAPWQLGCGVNLLGYSGPNSDGGSFFDDLANELQSRNTLALVNSPFSIELWFWSFGTPAANQFLLSWDNGGVPQTNLIWTTTLHAQFGVNAVALASLATLSLQRWHHLVGTYDNSNLKLYVDGALSNTTPLAATLALTKSLAVGGTPGGAVNFFLGCISEIAVYSTALSLARISAHFSAADQPNQAPIYTAVKGNLAGSSIIAGTDPGGTQDLIVDESLIYAAVHRVVP